MTYNPKDNRLRQKAIFDIGTVLDKFVDKQQCDDKYRGLKLKIAWENVATAGQLEHTNSVIFSKNETDGSRVIVVYVDDSASAAAMTMQREMLRLLMERELACSLKEMRFKITRNSKWRQTFSKDHSGGAEELVEPSYIERGPEVELTAYEDGYARELVSLISDEQLKISLYKALRADLEWKKSIGAKKIAQIGDIGA